MSLTLEQLTARRGWLGASDVAKIMCGEGKDVWAEKTGKLPLPTQEEIDKKERKNRAIWWGNRLEEILIARCEVEFDTVITRQPEFKAGHIVVHPDGVDEDGVLYEAKTSKIAGPGKQYAKPGEDEDEDEDAEINEWDDSKPDGIPVKYIWQTQAQMWIAGAGVNRVPSLVGDRRFGLFHVFEVEANDALMQRLEEEVWPWWDKYVVTDTPPPEGRMSEDIYKRVWRQPGSVQTVEDGVLATWHALNQQRIAIAREEKIAKDNLLSDIGFAEAAVAPGLVGAVTYFEQKDTKFDVTTFKAEHPALYEQYVKRGTHRVLRWKEKGL